MVSHNLEKVVTIKVPVPVKLLLKKYNIQARAVLIKGLSCYNDESVVDLFMADKCDTGISVRVSNSLYENLLKVDSRLVLFKGLECFLGREKLIRAMLDHNRSLLKRHLDDVSFYESEVKMLEKLLQDNVNHSGLHFSEEPV